MSQIKCIKYLCTRVLLDYMFDNSTRISEHTFHRKGLAKKLSHNNTLSTVAVHIELILYSIIQTDQIFV